MNACRGGRVSSYALWSALALIFLGGLAPPARGANNAPDDDPATAGRTLFLHHWRAKDSLSSRGDGLGPMFNERSCAACHSQGGAGGGGSRDKNVQILSIVLPSFRPRQQSEEFWEMAALAHPGLIDHPGGVVLHRFSTNPEYEPWRWQRQWAATAVGSPFVFSASVFRPQDQDDVAAQAIRRALNNGRLNTAGTDMVKALQAVVDRAHGSSAGRGDQLKLILTERNPTALFGAGLLDAISDDDLLLEERHQASRGPEFAPRAGRSAGRNEDLPAVGRVARLADGRIGRFGWKGQNATLADFARNACAVELGLEVSDRQQATDPRHPQSTSPGIDLSEADCTALVAYLSALPAPESTVGKTMAKNVATGRALFDKVGCADCHVQNMGQATNVYSDLLLHDMGDRLTGPAYYGTVTGSFADPSPGAKAGQAVVFPSGSEWRTPPLWGCRDSAPYMHDGRAAKLTDAIMAHGGQGARSARLYGELSAHEQRMLVNFLQSLAAPKQAERAKPSRATPQPVVRRAKAARET